MLDFLRLFLHVLAAPLRTQAQLEAQVTLLRHQLNVLRRQAPSKPRLTAADRLLLVWLWRLFPSLCCVGIGRAFGFIGDGSRVRAAAAQSSG
jgi:putative transposase